MKLGPRMLAVLIRRFDRVVAAWAAWNASAGAVRRAGDRAPAIEQTRARVHLVLELHRALLQHSQPARSQRLAMHP